MIDVEAPERTASERDTTRAEPRESRGIASLFKEIRDESAELFRQEVALARTEVAEKMSRAGRHVQSIFVGALLLIPGAIVLLIAIGNALAIALLAGGMDQNAIWLGPLIVGVIVAAIGIALLLQGKRALQEEKLVPEKTAHSLKENKEWIQSKGK